MMNGNSIQPIQAHSYVAALRPLQHNSATFGYLHLDKLWPPHLFKTTQNLQINNTLIIRALDVEVHVLHCRIMCSISDCAILHKKEQRIKNSSRMKGKKDKTFEEIAT